jgi:hypothetical protein
LAADLGEGPSLNQGEDNKTASISYGVANPESSITGPHDGGTTYNTADAGCPALIFETSHITAASADAENDGQDSEDKAIEHNAHHPDHGKGPARVTGTSAAMLGHGHGDTDPYDADDEGLDSGGEDDDGMDELDPIPPNLLLIDDHNPATSTSTSTPRPASPSLPPSTLAPTASESDHASLRAWFDLPSRPGTPSTPNFHTNNTDADADADSDGTHPLTYYTDTTTGYDSLPDDYSDDDADEEEEARRRRLTAAELAAVIWLVEQELEGLSGGVWDGLMGVDTDGEGVGTTDGAFEDGEGGGDGGGGGGWDTGSDGSGSGSGSESGSGSGREGGGDGDGDGDGLEGGGEGSRVWGCEEGCGCDWCWGLGPEW